MEKEDLTKLINHANNDDFAEFDSEVKELVKTELSTKVQKLNDGIFDVINSEINQTNYYDEDDEY